LELPPIASAASTTIATTTAATVAKPKRLHWEGGRQIRGGGRAFGGEQQRPPTKVGLGLLTSEAGKA